MNGTTIRTIGRLTAAVLLAAVLAPAIVTTQEAQAPPPPGKTPPAKMLPREALGLTPEQEKALEGFRKARMEQDRAFREEMMKIGVEMRALGKDPKANEAKINALIDKRAKLQADRDKAAFRHRIEVGKILTPEQLEKMKTFRDRFAGRPGFYGRGRMGMGPRGSRGPGMGRFRGPGFGPRPFRHFRHFRWRW